MTIVDRTGNRAEQLKNLLTSVIPAAIPAGVETEVYSFGTSLRGPLQQPPDTLGDETTDIAGALLALAHERERFNIRAVIMLSDGMYTEGENPVYRAVAMGIPVSPSASETRRSRRTSWFRGSPQTTWCTPEPRRPSMSSSRVPGTEAKKPSDAS